MADDDCSNCSEENTCSYSGYSYDCYKARVDEVKKAFSKYIHDYSKQYFNENKDMFLVFVLDNKWHKCVAVDNHVDGKYYLARFEGMKGCKEQGDMWYWEKEDFEEINPMDLYLQLLEKDNV